MHAFVGPTCAEVANSLPEVRLHQLEQTAQGRTMRTVNEREVGSLLRSLTNNVRIDMNAEHEFQVFYPSGNEFCIKGKLRLVAIVPPSITPVIEVNAEKVLCLDPRGVIVVLDPDLVIVYAPTAPCARLDVADVEWLAEHREWPGELFIRKGWAIDATPGDAP